MTSTPTLQKAMLLSLGAGALFSLATRTSLELRGQAVSACATVAPRSAAGWQNQEQVYDANNDKRIDADDLAFIDAAMKTVGSLQMPLPGKPSGNHFYDVNGDGVLSPDDYRAVQQYIVCIASPPSQASSNPAADAFAGCVDNRPRDGTVSVAELRTAALKMVMDIVLNRKGCDLTGDANTTRADMQVLRQRALATLSQTTETAVPPGTSSSVTAASQPSVPAPFASSAPVAPPSSPAACRTARATGGAWQNQRDPYDVNDDGLITQRDALDIQDTINADGSRGLPASRGSSAKFYDVNGDGWVVPVDMLIVSNFITCMNVPTITALSSASSASAPPTHGTSSSHATSIAGATGQCKDGADNDGDGTKDGEDPACIANPIGTEDGDVGLALTLTTSTPTFRTADGVRMKATVTNNGPDAVTKGFTVWFNPPVDHRGLAPLMTPKELPSECSVGLGRVQCTVSNLLPAGKSVSFAVAYTYEETTMCTNIYATNAMKAIDVQATVATTQQQRNVSTQTVAKVTATLDCPAVSSGVSSSLGAQKPTQSSLPLSETSSRSMRIDRWSSDLPCSYSDDAASPADIVVLKDDSDEQAFSPGAFTLLGREGNGGHHEYPYLKIFEENFSPEPATWNMGALPAGTYLFSALWPDSSTREFGNEISGVARYRITAWSGERVIAVQYVIGDQANRSPSLPKGVVCGYDQRFNSTGKKIFLPTDTTKVLVALLPIYTGSCHASEDCSSPHRLTHYLAADSVMMERVQKTLPSHMTSFLCGDGTRQADTEQCDDGNTISNDRCTNLCEINGWCGDGIVQRGAGEECDDILDSCKQCKTVFVPTECTDGTDNDGDMLIDGADPGCHSDFNATNDASFTQGRSAKESSDRDTVQSCADKRDNDGDGLTDAADPGCHWDRDVFNAASYQPLYSEGNHVQTECSDGKDNDGDGLIDTQDANCHHDANVFNRASFVGTPEWTVSNGATFREGSAVRLNIQCRAGSPCTWSSPGTCGDGKDNDDDALIDAKDPGCHTDGNVSNNASFNPLAGETSSSQPAHASSAQQMSRQASSGARAQLSTIKADDQDASFSLSIPSMWSVWSDSAPMGGSYRWGEAGTATWNLGLVPAGTYRLEATWYGYPTAHTAASYTVTVNETNAGTFRVDQSRSAGSEFSWETVAASLPLSATSTVKITLTADGSSPVFADAVRLVPLP